MCLFVANSLFSIVAQFQKKLFVACEVLIVHVARRGIDETLTESPPPTSPERRLPLRQLPSERSFSASPRKLDLVSNDRVFLLLNSRSAFIDFLPRLSALPKFVTLAVTVSVFLRQNSAY